MSYLRSIFISAPIVAIATIVLGGVSLAASIFDRSGNALHNIARFWGRILLAAGFVRVRADGAGRLDPHASYVFVANHGSYMDIPAVLAALPHQFRFFAKKGLFKIPFLGFHLKHAGHLPVDRTNARNSLKSMAEGARIVRERGISVLLFPEGGRSVEGLRGFKEGAAYIAIKAGVPVVPIAIIGMRELLPQGSLHLRSGKVKVRVGEPISTAGMTIKDRDELTERLRREVASLLGVDVTPAAPAHPSVSGSL
ncbi:MAG: lysophospholipid acyltransferase family protein [Bryobacteraceae bacterium]|jgi:1-acyl-sn-glycerol-3-phosphate acyltransferase